MVPKMSLERVVLGMVVPRKIPNCDLICIRQGKNKCRSCFTRSLTAQDRFCDKSRKRSACARKRRCCPVTV